MRKLNPLVIAGVLVALLGAGALATVVQDDGGDSSSPRVAALVATAPIEKGTPADQAPLEVRQVPADVVPEGTPADPAALSGQIALRPLAAGEIASPGSFGLEAVAAAGGVILPEGKEAIAVELGFVPGGLRYVVPGNEITVWATTKVGEGQIPETQPILQNVQVVATTPGTGTGAPAPVTEGPGSLQFLLALTQPEEALLITEQARGSSLYFTLSNTGQGGN